MKKNRVAITLLILGSLIAGFCFIPFPYGVKCSLQLQPKDAATVFVTAPGKLVEVRVKQNQKVKKGDVIAVLENPDLEVQLQGYESQLANYEESLLVAEAERNRGDTRRIEEIEQLKYEIDGTRDQRDLKKDEFDRLTITASRDGTIIVAPSKKAQPNLEGQLPPWSGSLLSPKNMGSILAESDVICLIGDPESYEGEMAVDQSDIRFVLPGQGVEVLMEAYTSDSFETEIESENDISREPMQLTPESLSFQAGGTIATKTDKTGRHIPLSATYQVFVPVENKHGKFFRGMRGRAKIEAEPQSLGKRLYRYMAKTFHFDL